jgi:hypothetical protein
MSPGCAAVADDVFGVVAHIASASRVTWPARTPPPLCCTVRSLSADVPIARAVLGRPHTRTQHAANQRREVIALGQDAGTTADALAQLGAIPQRIEQSQMEDDQHQARVRGCGQVVQTFDERIEDRAIFLVILGQQIDHLGQVVRVRR